MSRAFRLGAFIVATLLIFAAFVYWIGDQKFLFNRTYRLNADFQNVAGLTGGAEVRVGGLREGEVKRIQLPSKPGDKVQVVMDLVVHTRDVVKKDSVAAIKSEGLVGDKFVEISFGSDQSPKVGNGDTIQGEPPLQLSDVVKKTDALLDSAGEAANNFKDISAKINQGSGTIGALVNDKQVYQNVAAGASALKEDTEAMKHNFLLRGFFNKRGYEDASELKKHEIPRLPAKPVAKQFTVEADKIFDKPDTAKLKDSKALDETGAYLQSNPFRLAVVAAYTDMKGDSAKDKELTEARAMVVRDYLVQHFKLDDTRLKTIGMGKSASAGQSGVEIMVYAAEGTPVAQTRNPSPK